MNCTITNNDMVTDAYQSGMAQPAVLAVYSDTVQDQSSVLYSWSRYQVTGGCRGENGFSLACVSVCSGAGGRGETAAHVSLTWTVQ